jgi:prefoldin subunit 1
MVRSQIGIKTREIRKLELTSKEVSELPSDTNVYEGVGKM